MSKRIAAKITGVAGYVPPQVITNADIEKMVDTNDQWIRERTGIGQRHIVDRGVGTSHLATAAARQVLEKTNTSAEEIDLIIVATVTPDMLFPATACLVQDRLGAKHAWGFDLSGACSGFLYALTIGAQFVGAGTHRKALVIGSDVMTSIVNYEDRSTCVLFGDGAGAVLVEPVEPGADGILDFNHDIDGSGGDFLCMPAGGSLHPASHETVDRKMHYVHQSGSQVFKYAVRRMSEVACQLLERNGYTHRDVAAGRATPGEFADHPRDAGTVGRRRFQSAGKHRSPGEYHGGHNPTGIMRRRGARAFAPRGLGSAGSGGRRLHDGRNVAAVGLLSSC